MSQVDIGGFDEEFKDIKDVSLRITNYHAAC